MNTFSDIIQAHSNRFAEQSRLHFLNSADSVESELSYLSLHTTSQQVASYLDARQQVNHPVVIVSASTDTFCQAFFGCLYSGAVAVPAALPNKKGTEAYERLLTILEDTQSSLMIVPEESLQQIESLLADEEAVNIECITVSQILQLTQQLLIHRVSLDAPAFIQYSSGTTSRPKGIVITHGNLMSNLATITETFKSNRDTRLLSWLPLHHDMGLIGSLLGVIFVGGTGYYMKPAYFVQNPISWMKGITHFNINTSGGPNFSYDLCVSNFNPQDGECLDLSSWKTAFNGAEVVRPETLDRFHQTFNQFGFDKGAFLPCYGLAECTLLVSGSHLSDMTAAGAQLDDTTKNVCCSGKIADAYTVAVVDAETGEQVKDGDSGEIWISGPSVSAGFWGKDSEANQCFNRSLAAFPNVRFLQSGDLGYLRNNSLYVTGRCKEIVIVRGKNYVAGELEYCVKDIDPALVSHATVATSMEIDGGESLVIFQEIKRHYARKSEFNQLAEKIAGSIAEKWGIRPGLVVFVLQHQLARTTSGKIKRVQLTDKFQSGAMKPLKTVELATASSFKLTDLPKGNDSHSIGVWLMKSIASLNQFESSELRRHTPFSHLGLESSLAANITGEINHYLNIELPPTAFFEFENINELADEIASQLINQKMTQEGHHVSAQLN